MNYIKRRSIHSGRLERWLGADKIARLSKYMTDGGGQGQRWYGPPINLSDVPGSVWVTGDGDFVGDFERGWYDSAIDSLSRHFRELWKSAGKPVYLPEPQFGAGFTSLSDALLRQGGGDGQMLAGGTVSKAGQTGVVGNPTSLWARVSIPTAGSDAAAAPGGTVHDKSNTGALTFDNPSSGTLHLTGADILCTVISNSLMLYDRLFSVGKTMNSTATEAVTGVPTRYQSTTATAADYAGGNFLFVEVGATSLAATAHNWTTCLYTDQDGNTTQTLPSVTGVSGAGNTRFDMPTSSWFCPLASGDVGIKALSQMQCSALVATGIINFVIGHPIGIMAFPVQAAIIPFDWLTNRQQAPRIFDDACLALIEMPKPTAGSATYSGQIYVARAA